MTAPVQASELLDAFQARRLTADIRNALAVADDLLARAYRGRAWEALGHKSWAAYCAAELPELRHLKLRAPERRARALAIVAAGGSVRDAAASTAAGVATVHADLNPATPPAPAGDLTGRVVALLAEHPDGLDVFAVARRLKVRQAQVSPALSRLAAAGRVTYTPGARRGATGTYRTR